MAQVSIDFYQTAYVSSGLGLWRPTQQDGAQELVLEGGRHLEYGTRLLRLGSGRQLALPIGTKGFECWVLHGMLEYDDEAFSAWHYLRVAKLDHEGLRTRRLASNDGCLLFLRVGQMSTKGDQFFAQHIGALSGRQQVFAHEQEKIDVVPVTAGERYAFAASYHVRELLVLAGSVSWQQAETRQLGAFSWVRMRPGEPLRVNALEDSVIVSKTRPRSLG